MERMTKKEQLAGRTVNYIGEDDCFDVWSVPKKFMGNAVDRLAAYEDTGVEPEEVRRCLEFEDICIRVEHNLSWKRPTRRYPASAIGKTVFLTREEDALRREQDG